MLLRLWLATLVLTAAACRSEDPCPAAQAAAAAAVGDYADRILDAGPGRGPLDEWTAVDEQIERARKDDERVSCRTIGRMVDGPQPKPEEVAALVEEAARVERLGATARALDGLDPAIASRLTTAGETFHAAFARFEAEVPRAALREGRAWSPASLTYLNGLKDAWCGWTEVQHEAFEAHIAALERRVVALERQATADNAERTRILDRAVPAQELSTQLSDSKHRVPVDVPRILADDPAFADAGALVRAVDTACR